MKFCFKKNQASQQYFLLLMKYVFVGLWLIAKQKINQWCICVGMQLFKFAVNFLENKNGYQKLMMMLNLIISL